MAVRPHPKKPGHWIIDYYPNGKKRDPVTKKVITKREIIPFKGSEAEAREIEMELRRKPNQPPPISPKIVDAIPEFLVAYKNKNQPGTITDFHWAMKQFLPHFGNLKFSQLTQTIFEQYKTKRLDDGVKKRTINRELSYVSVIIEWATENNYCQPLPFKIKFFPKKQTRAPIPIVHTIDEVQNIGDSINNKKKGLFYLLYDAGLRRTEAFTIKKEQVDLDSRLLRIIGKGGKERLVPILTERLYEELKEKADSVKSGYLYINPVTKKPYKDIRGALKAAAVRAGVEYKRINHHLMRHNHGTHSAYAGVDVRATQMVLGHSDLKTTEIYTHLAAHFLKSEGAKFAQTITKKNSVIGVSP